MAAVLPNTHPFETKVPVPQSIAELLGAWPSIICLHECLPSFFVQCT